MENNNHMSKLEKKLLESRIITIYGEINQELAEKVTAQLLVMDNSNHEQPIKIFINSQGGHVEAGDTIHDMMKFVASEVYIVGTGWVASAGVTIYLGAKKENRFALPNTRFMIHQPLGGVRGQATDIKIEMEELKRVKLRINTLISDATGQPLSKVEKDTDRNYWMDTKEAIDYGIISKVISNVAELEMK